MRVVTLLRVVSALLALLALTPPAEAREHTHGNLVFEIPANWRLGKLQPDGSLELRAKLPGGRCSGCVILIGADTHNGDDPLRFLTQSPRLLLGSRSPDPTPLGAPRPLTIGGHRGALAGQIVDGNFRALVAIARNGQLQSFAFFAKGETNIERAIEVFESDLIGLITGARFLEGAPALSPGPGPLYGIWQGAGTDWTIGMDMTVQPKPFVRLYVFWGSGYVYRGAPPQGIAPPQPEAFAQQGNKNWGSYRVDGHELTLLYADGSEERVEITADLLSFACGSARCSQVEPVADGASLAGTLRDDFAASFGGESGVSGTVSTARQLSFEASGAFRERRSASGSANLEGGGAATGTTRGATGRYRVENGLLILSYDDSRPDEHHLIYHKGDRVMIGSAYFEGTLPE